jgi:hypothetical protein
MLQWDTNGELLEETLMRFLRPLLRRQDAEHDKPLTVYLPSLAEFDDLLNVNGIEFGQNYPVLWDWD